MWLRIMGVLVTLAVVAFTIRVVFLSWSAAHDDDVSDFLDELRKLSRSDSSHNDFAWLTYHWELSMVGRRLGDGVYDMPRRPSKPWGVEWPTPQREAIDWLGIADAVRKDGVARRVTMPRGAIVQVDGDVTDEQLAEFKQRFEVESGRRGV